MDEAAFLRTIIDAPDDDGPRLVYADWLEEHGETARAEFIRVQCELAHCRDGIESCPPDSRCGRCYGCVRRERAAELLQRHRVGWLLELTRAIYPDAPGSAAQLAAGMTFTRGFPDHITADVATLFGDRCGPCEGSGRAPGIAAQLYAATPVCRVVLSDKRPEQRSRRKNALWDWWPPLGRIIEMGPHVADSARLPESLWQSVCESVGADPGQAVCCGYPTADAAHAALSAAAVKLLRLRGAQTSGRTPRPLPAERPARSAPR